MKMTLKMAVLSVLASFLVFGSVAQAEYPEKPVTFIVPWPPGDPVSYTHLPLPTSDLV